MSSKLFLVPTPVGNLEDITFRAIRILKEVDLILAEDTRKTGILLSRYEIKNKVEAFHKFNEHQRLSKYIELLKDGLTIALVSDAGTPSISDPGFLIIRECIRNNIEVECLPGATAFIPALVNSGLPSDRFVFEGFLPHKKGRLQRLKQWQTEERTIIFYESPHRLIKTLEQLLDFFPPQQPVSISRELTKIHEETLRGTLKEMIAHFQVRQPKGEFVVILSTKSQ